MDLNNEETSTQQAGCWRRFAARLIRNIRLCSRNEIETIVMYVRVMNREDIPRVSDILCSCYRWLGEKEGFTPHDVRFLIRQRGSIDTVKRESEIETYCVACDDTETVGMLSVRDNEITKLYVHPRRHREGLGKLLFEKAEEIITANGHTKIILGTIGMSPMPFYESMGMVVSGRKPNKMGQESSREVILMEKEIVKELKHNNRVHKDTASRRL